MAKACRHNSIDAAGVFFATFAFFAAKHQSRVGSFSVERVNSFYTIYTFYTAIICVGLRGGYFWAGRDKPLRYFVGVVPTTRLNVRMKCAWSKNPTSEAISLIRRSVVPRSVFAALTRTFVM